MAVQIEHESGIACAPFDAHQICIWLVVRRFVQLVDKGASSEALARTCAVVMAYVLNGDHWVEGRVRLLSGHFDFVGVNGFRSSFTVVEAVEGTGRIVKVSRDRGLRVLNLHPIELKNSQGSTLVVAVRRRDLQVIQSGSSSRS